MAWNILLARFLVVMYVIGNFGDVKKHGSVTEAPVNHGTQPNFITYKSPNAQENPKKLGRLNSRKYGFRAMLKIFLWRLLIGLLVSLSGLNTQKHSTCDFNFPKQHLPSAGE